MARWMHPIYRRLMVALLALALGLVGLGHRTLAPETLLLAAYAMPDGTLPDLCIGGSADQDGLADAPCPVCTLCAALPMPAATTVPLRQLSASLVAWPVVSQATSTAHQPSTPPARGPPRPFLIV